MVAPCARQRLELRQPSAAFTSPVVRGKSGRGPPHSKTLPRRKKLNVPSGGKGIFGRGIRKVVIPFPCRSFPCHLGNGIGIPCWNRTSLCGFANHPVNCLGQRNAKVAEIVLSRRNEYSQFHANESSPWIPIADNPSHRIVIVWLCVDQDSSQHFVISQTVCPTKLTCQSDPSSDRSKRYALHL